MNIIISKYLVKKKENKVESVSIRKSQFLNLERYIVAAFINNED